MASGNIVSVLAIAALLAVTIQESSAVICWNAVSEQPTGGICSDSYNKPLIAEKGQNWSILECSPQNVSERSEVCIRFNPHNNGEEARVCFSRDVKSSKSDCCHGVTKFLEEINNGNCN